MKQGKIFFISLPKLFSFFRKSILNFQIFKCHDVIKCLRMKHETHFIQKLGKQTESGNEIWPAYVIIQKNFKNLLPGS